MHFFGNVNLLPLDLQTTLRPLGCLGAFVLNLDYTYLGFCNVHGCQSAETFSRHLHVKLLKSADSLQSKARRGAQRDQSCGGHAVSVLGIKSHTV